MVVDWHQGRLVDIKDEKVVALTFDDGSWFDYYDLDHPTCGLQRSFLNILRDFQSEYLSDSYPRLNASSFVICSPVARSELDKKGLIGKGWWGDEWWKPAQESGLLNIECHSWDHNHPDLDFVAQRDQVKGNFASIESYVDCDVQIARSGDYIQEQLAGTRPTLFAYPWGQASDYLMHHYLPKFHARHGFTAAFTTNPRPVTKSDNIWALPRYVFGRDWKSPAGLVNLLLGCA
jgi:peptidoglycan/xylan/chitin deacetylase (PgdA/CDA1 family)